MNKIVIDRLVQSKRKTFSVEINKKNEVIVRAPLTATKSEIKKFIEKNADWILRKQELILEHKAAVKKSFTTGELFKLLGNDYPLEIADNYRYAFHFTDNKFIISSDYLNHARELFIKFYKLQAKRVITNLAVKYSQITGIEFQNVRISSAATRWGSCSSKKNLSFTWRLVMAPEEIVTYVVIHELAHIVQMNHSKNFWKIVESLDPDYKKHKKWLRENGNLLDV